MLVQWNEERVKYIEYNGSKVVLLPGVNEVAAKDWTAVRGIVQDEIAADQITELFVAKSAKAKDGEEAAVVYKDFTELEAKEATKLIQNTYSIATLTNWLDREGRSDVRAALQKRIDFVNTPKAK